VCCANGIIRAYAQIGVRETAGNGRWTKEGWRWTMLMDVFAGSGDERGCRSSSRMDRLSAAEQRISSERIVFAIPVH